MAPDLEQLAKLLRRKWAEWEQVPGGAINYIQYRGSDALAEELAADPDLHLAKVCGIFTNPPEEAMADGVKAVLGLVNPLWGGVAMILSAALLKACEQRRYVTQKQAEVAVGVGAVVAGVGFILAWLFGGD